MINMHTLQNPTIIQSGKQNLYKELKKEHSIISKIRIFAKI